MFYAALDVSLRSVAICIIDQHGKVRHEGSIPSDVPDLTDAFQDVTERGDLVPDAVLGSGASLIAAERTGRRFRGLDIDPLYVDLAVERWRALTGGQPELLRLAKAA